MPLQTICTVNYTSDDRIILNINIIYFIEDIIILFSVLTTKIKGFQTEEMIKRLMEWTLKLKTLSFEFGNF